MDTIFNLKRTRDSNDFTGEGEKVQKVTNHNHKQKYKQKHNLK